MKKIMACAITNKGNRRANNEDHFYLNGIFQEEENADISEAIQVVCDFSEKVLVAVFDGLGGNRDGEIASLISVKEMDKMYEMFRKAEMDSTLFFKKACTRMNYEVCRSQNELFSDMGTTVSAILWNHGEYVVCNVGDSPIFQMKNGKIQRIHEEHTTREMFEQLNINRKPELTQCIGINEEELTISPFINIGIWEPEMSFLICSDGLTDMVSDHQIEEVLLMDMPQKEKIQYLMRLALDNGGIDNITIILMECSS